MLLASCLCLPSNSAIAQDPPSSVKSLHYGDALFHLYQQDYFGALTKLQQAEHNNRLGEHTQEAKIIEASLYLSYGMHHYAQEIFQNLLAKQDISASQRNKIWFHLAKLAFQKGHAADAEQALLNIDRELSGGLEGQRQLLHSQVLSQLGRFNEAAKILTHWRSNNVDLAPYAQYNLAIALIRDRQTDKGIQTFEALAKTNDINTEEQLALIDKTNLNIGYTLLKQQNYVRAQKQFEQIRQEGPYSNEALLAVGWAHAHQNNYHRALSYWQILSQLDPSHPAVQEALLNVPYAYSKLGADQTAIERYEQNLDALRQQKESLAQIINAISAGAIVAALQHIDPATRFGDQWQLDVLPSTEQSQYLGNLMAGHPFREGLRNYLDLGVISNTLTQWQTTINAFNDILATRKQGYENKSPLVPMKIANLNLAGKQQQFRKLQQHYQAIDTTQFSLALASPSERKAWLTLLKMEPVLKRLPDTKRNIKTKRKHRILRGLLIWQMEIELNGRMWKVRKGLHQLEALLQTASDAKESATQATYTAQQGFSGYDKQITILRQYAESLVLKTNSLSKQQAEALQNLALESLNAQQTALNHHIARAQFAVAQIYDRAMIKEMTNNDEQAVIKSLELGQ